MNKSFFFALLTSVIWGMAPAFEKVGLSGKIDPYVGVIVRTIPIIIFGVAGLFFLGKTNAISNQLELRTVLFLVLGGLIAGFFGQLSLYTALKSGEASVVIPISATYPLTTLIIAVLFLGEQLTIAKLVGIVMVVTGVILLR